MIKKVFSIVLFLFIKLSYSQSPLIPYRDGKLWGFCDTLGKIKVKPKYVEIKDFTINYDYKNSSRYVVKKNLKYAVIDQNRKTLLPELNLYDSIHLIKYYPNHFLVYRNGKVGLFYKNVEKIQCLYDEIEITENQSYIVKKGKLNGLINANGKLIIPVEYFFIRKSWVDENENNLKFVWEAQNSLVEKKYYDSKLKNNSDFSNNGAINLKEIEELKNKIDYDKLYNEIRFKYDQILNYSKYSNYVIVVLNNKMGVYSFEQQNEIIAPIYEDLTFFNFDNDKVVYKFKKDEKFGLVKEGNLILLPCIYDKIDYDKKNNVNLLQINDKKGIIVFNSIYQSIHPKYNSIKYIDSIPVSFPWQFSLYEVTTKNGKGLIGENGVEYFKD